MIFKKLASRDGPLVLKQGLVAQLVERKARGFEVGGSIPSQSTINTDKSQINGLRLGNSETARRATPKPIHSQTRGNGCKKPNRALLNFAT